MNLRKNPYEICWNPYDPSTFAVGSVDLRYPKVEMNPSHISCEENLRIQQTTEGKKLMSNFQKKSPNSVLTGEHELSEKFGNEIAEDDVISQIKRISLNSINYEVQGVRCLGWTAGKMMGNANINNSEASTETGLVNTSSTLAVGVNSGKIVLLQNSTTAVELVPKHLRACNCLAWNPHYTNLLAAGYDKVRGDDSTFVWDIDVTSGNVRASPTSIFAESLGGTQPKEEGNSWQSLASFSTQDSKFTLAPSQSAQVVTQPAYQVANGEATIALAWMPSSPMSLIAGTGAKWLRIYDLRAAQQQPQSIVAHTKMVMGVEFDPFNDQRLFTFSEDGQIKIWDLRHLSEPTLVFNTNSKNLLQVKWCPTESRILASCGREEREVKIWDIGDITSKNPEFHAFQNPKPITTCEISETISSFSWHPKNRYRMLAASNSGVVHLIPLRQSIPVSWGANHLGLTFNKEIYLRYSDREMDISVVMKERVLQGYSMDPKVNQSVAESEANHVLKSVWIWMSSFMNGYNFKTLQIQPFQGILSILEAQKSPSKKIDHSVEVPLLFPIYSSPERSACLHILGGGWGLDKKESMENTIQHLELEKQFERAAALSVFHLDMKRAIASLMQGHSQRPDSPLRLVATALSGCDEHSIKSPLWRESCSRLRVEIGPKEIYLNACLAFLCVEGGGFSKLIEEIELPLTDKIALCCRFLNDEQLKQSIALIAGAATKGGNLEGLFLTGLTAEGIKIAQSYIDRTGDIQTAVLLFSHVVPKEFKDKQVDSWVQIYREFLDRSQLWHQRAKFDIKRKDAVASQVLPKCHYCPQPLGKALISRQTIPKPKLNLGIPNQQNVNISHCPGCRKPLPRCALCLSSLSINVAPLIISANIKEGKESGVSAEIGFDGWWTWCQACRHGGHAGHMAAWFEKHGECPVSDCPCLCRKRSQKY